MTNKLQHDKITQDKKDRVKYDIESDVSFEERDEQKIRRRREARDKEKNESRTLGSRLDKWLKSDNREHVSWLLEQLPYRVTPSYIHHNGRCMSILELYNRPGTNRDMDFMDVIDIIPVDTLDNVEMHLFIKDVNISGDEKKRLILKNAREGKNTIESAQQTGPKEDADNKSVQKTQASDFSDYDEYELILDSAEPVVVFCIQLAVIGPDKETVEEQIQILNQSMNRRHEGITWDSLGGDQYNRFNRMFGPLEKTRFVMTTTGYNYGGLNFSVNAGLNDPNGLPIGPDALALTNSTSFFDMDGTLEKQAIIAIPRSATIDYYIRENSNSQPSVSSIMCQLAANQAVLNGHRAHHLVLNDFDYFEPNMYYRKPDVPGVFAKYNVAQTTINPLQGFGDIQDVVAIFSRLTDKIANIFSILTNLSLDEDQRAIILKAVEAFYLKQSKWTPDADKYPGRTQIVNIVRPESYPTLGMFITEFTTMAKKAANEKRELKADRIDTLQSIMDQAMTAYRGVLNRPTSIKPSDAYQTYYDFNDIDSSRMKQVQYLNLLPYIIHEADEGDVIVIHGTDQIWSRVLEMSRETIQAAENKKIRFIFGFDTVLSTEIPGKEQLKNADMFDMHRSFYNDLDTDIDWSIVGRCVDDIEVDAYETAMARSLSATIRSEMKRKSNSQALIHRARGDINSFTILKVLI